MNRKTYPSDISREQFAPLLPLLESARKRTAPRQVDLYDVFCAIFLIIDAQSVKNTDTAMEKGYDAGKKVSGIKRHIAVDTQGLPHALAVTTADITDRKGCLLALERDKDNLGAV